MITTNHQPKKILFIESGTIGGGSFVSLTQHLSVITRDKYIPIVICFNQTKYLEVWKSFGVKTYLLTDRVYSLHDKRFATKLYKHTFSRFLRLFPFLSLTIMRFYFRETIDEIEGICRKEQISLIHLNDNIMRDAFGAIVVEKTNLPCISHLRSIHTKPMGLRLASFCNKHIRNYIANSENTKLGWSNLGIDEAKITVIYNGIATDDVESIDIRKELSIAPHFKYVIGCIANLAKAKGHQFLLNAFSKIKSKDFCLVLVGHGPLEEELREQATALGIIDAIKFAGYRTNAINIIKSLDMLVVPSKREAFGRTILEGMLAKIPIVATNVGGIPEVIQDHKTGLIVEYGDEDGLAEAIETLNKDHLLRNELIKNAEAHLLNTFTIEKYRENTESIYAQALTEGERQDGN